MQPKCEYCDKGLDDGPLHKCPICFKQVCEEHTHRMRGREFCSHGCALYFFFGDGDDWDRSEE